MLAPGHHLYRGADGSWRYSAPGDVFVRIGGDDRLLTLVQGVEAGLSGVVVPAADRTAVSHVSAALTARGVLRAPDRVAAAQVPPVWKVWIEGDGPATERLVDLLVELLDSVDGAPGRDANAVRVQCTVGALDEAVVAGSQVVVSCAQWLPDDRWRTLDRWCADHGTPWHGCYAEGDGFVVGPLSIPGRTASYRDTRGRRLAAAALPDELRAHWAYLDSDAPRPAARFPRTAVAVLAGLLAADLLALAAGTIVPSEGHQLVVNPRAASINRHPVLPLPDLAGDPA
ncbi:hypothetical protein MXD61_07590 [Frankia sp. AgPm24]|uniref:hypothetical protein n=1 Tax=Frankia sp. AgPm24 TaxID=631128 RepID=UPI00200D3DE3|nr:hypothetical protein [Frankia sp. AgPm24]MCK9921752.1 hypothetical protein [Frankia sp. AgPm24]